MVIGGPHDLVPQVARGHLAVDPVAVPLQVCACVLLGCARLGFVLQGNFATVLYCLHEAVGHAHRDVEVAQFTRVFGMDEFLNIWVVAAQHTHLGTAACTGRFHRFARSVKHAHVADRAGRTALGAAYPGTAWAYA